jgi:hypothetical protein
MVSAWRPESEAEAAGAMAGFIEWLRAGGRREDADPAAVLAWVAGRSADFDAAVVGFMGWRHPGPHFPRSLGEAVVLHRHGRRQTWAYGALPSCIVDRLRLADAVGLAAFHLFHCGTRPDDRLLWMGDPADPLPLGALYLGATVILADAPSEALADAERARPVRPPLRTVKPPR